MKKQLLLFTCVLLFTAGAAAQSYKEAGSQAVINYTPKEYNAQQQNWAITQDERGIMYFGNSSTGLLEFDGNSWRLYQVPNKSTIRSLANGDDGKIYAGAKADLGYFLPDSSGQLRFHSLMNFIPKDKGDFSDVWQTYVGNGKVYFNTDNYILIWDIKKREFNIISSQNGFHLMFFVNGALFVREWGKGLEVLQKDSLMLVKGGEKFANERIYVMLPFPGVDGTILIGTRTMGLFKYNGTDFIPFKTEADKYIKDNRIYQPGTVLSDGNILLGTLSGGAVVIDTTGKEISKYNIESGIISNDVLFTFQDHTGAIWLATDNGISRIDYSSPVSYFDSRNNFSATPSYIIRHKGIIYAATGIGVYSLDPNTSMFHKLSNFNNQSSSFADIGNELLVGAEGLFKIERDKLLPIRKTIGNEYSVSVLKQSRLNPDRIYVGTQSGLWSVIKTVSKWKDEGQILDNSDQPISIVEDKDGSVWMSTFASGLFRLTFQKDNKGNIILKKPVIEHFDKLNGLQDGYTYIEKINNINYFNTPDSIYKFDENKKIFYADTSDKIISTFYKITDNNVLPLLQQDNLGRIWIGAKGMLSMGTLQPDGSWNWISSPFNRFADETIISNIYAEKNGIVWFSTGSNIIKYDFGKKLLGSKDYAALVRRVDIGEDSTIYFGGRVDNPVTPEITFKNNSFKFRYSATSYEGKNVNKFKTFLDGFDDSWSQYSTETKKEYTNLPPGKYTFKVAALNLSGIESSTGIYSFEILPPWYRTWWAYSIYMIFLGLLVFTIDRVQRRRLTLKERQRSHLREMELRTEAAESEAKALQAENDRKKNVELLSEIGKEITATLDLDVIFYKLYEHVNQLADASIFGVGIYNTGKEEIEYRLAIEKGKRYPVYSRDIKDKNQFPVWCIENRKPVFINDVHLEYNKYIQHYKVPDRTLEDGTKSEEPLSIIYLPLLSKDRLLGVITIQSFKKNAYTDYHLNLLQNLASYTSIALDNADAYRTLKSTQDKLVTQEKLASLGALTAGIAHEIKNPLNFINNFSDVSNELLDELLAEIKNGNKEEIPEIVNNLKQNLEKITNHGKRADSIVKGMLLHSRGKSGEKALTDINELLDQYAALAYHGMRALDKDFNISFEKNYDKTIEKINVVPQDISRVFLNIINNACYAANDKKKKMGNGFVPLIKISTKKMDDKIEVHIRDNGNGIPDDIKNELFNPFFTTKPSGEGTGLGLSLSYDIVVKQHGGEIKVESKEGEGAEFIIIIPKL